MSSPFLTGKVAALLAALRPRRHADVAPSGGGATTRPVPLPELVAQAERIARALAAGQHRRRMAGMGEDFWQFRASQPGEPAGRIDWRQSARSDQLWVREREAESPQSIALWCDASPSMAWRSAPALPLKRDRALVCALSLASALLRGGERCALLGAGTSTRAGRFYTGQSMFESLAHALCDDAGTAPDVEWPDVRALPSHAQILIVSDFLWPEARIEAMLRAVATRPGRAHLLCVLDPAEMRLPYVGRVRFDAIEGEGEGEDSLTLPAVETLARDYDAEIARHLDVLRKACAATRADFALHVTEANPLPALLALHGRLSGAA